MRASFSWGATRFVILVLVGTVAIKIARFRPFRTLCQLIRHKKNGEVITKLVKFDRNPFIGGIKYIFAGIIANRNEYLLWHTFPSRFLVPTRHSFGWGLVNVQELGESITQEELDASHPFRTFLRSLPVDIARDLENAKNFCRYQGRICLLDYGSEATFALFSLQSKQDAVGVKAH